MEFNKVSSIPYYIQIQDWLRKKIKEDEYSHGDKLPSERELQNKFDVSRITVRKALEGLEYEGLVVKKQGKGSIVNKKPKMREEGSKLCSFTERVKSQVYTEVIEKEKMIPSQRISEAMNIAETEEIIYLERLRYVNDEPIALFHSYIRTDIGLGLDDDYSQSLYKLIENHIQIAYGEKRISARSCTEKEASLLRINKGDPVLEIKNFTKSTDDLIIEYAEGIYRSEKYEFEVMLER